MHTTAVLTCASLRNAIPRMAKKTLRKNGDGGRLRFYAIETDPDSEDGGRVVGTKTGEMISLLNRIRMFQSISDIHSFIGCVCVLYYLQSAYTVRDGFADARILQ